MAKCTSTVSRWISCVASEQLWMSSYSMRYECFVRDGGSKLTPAVRPHALAGLCTDERTNIADRCVSNSNSKTHNYTIRTV